MEQRQTSSHSAAQALEATAETDSRVTAVAMAEPDVEHAFDAVFGEGAGGNLTAISATAQEFDRAAVRELFSSIAANHARPVKDFISELRRGTATKGWIDICRPVMATLVQGAESTGLSDATPRLIDFSEALSLAEGGSGHFIEAAAQELILSTYQEMAEALPEAFREGDEDRRRDSIIIHALLKQIPDVGRVTFERLYGSGLTTIEAMFLANEEDLAATTGIPAWLCRRICDRIQEYRQQLETQRSDHGRKEHHKRLRHLLEDLRQKNEGFQRTTEEWTSPELADRKREYRQTRQLCALQIEVVLADMGELELVEKIRKMSFGQRIEALEQFVACVGLGPAEA